MFKYSKKSLENLNSCEERLIRLFSEAIKTSPMDISVLSGYRGKKEQNRLQTEGFSQLIYPRSMHNKEPSLAIDVVPFPVDWADINRYRILSYHIKIIAWKLDLKIDWGGDWKNFPDYPHWQLQD